MKRLAVLGMAFSLLAQVPVAVAQPLPAAPQQGNDYPTFSSWNAIPPIPIVAARQAMNAVKAIGNFATSRAKRLADSWSKMSVMDKIGFASVGLLATAGAMTGLGYLSLFVTHYEWTIGLAAIMSALVPGVLGIPGTAAWLAYKGFKFLTQTPPQDGVQQQLEQIGQ